MEITAPGPMGPLKGSLVLPCGQEELGADVPVLLIVPGSGPTDRDGNSPLGVSAAPYRLLGEAIHLFGSISVACLGQQMR